MQIEESREVNNINRHNNNLDYSMNLPKKNQFCLK